MKKLGVMLGIAALLPMVGLAGTITVNAPTGDGWLYVYDPSGANGTYVQQQFTSSGTISFDTAAVNMTGGSNYRVEVTYDSGLKWQSRVHWDTGTENEYIRTTQYFSGDKTYNVAVGEVASDSRKIEFLGDGNRRLSVKYQGATGGATSLGTMALNNELDAYMQVYKPITSSSGVSAQNMVKTWNPNNLEAGYDFSVADVDGYKMVTIFDLAGTFSANYLGLANGDNYDLRFGLADAGYDSAYWSSDDHGEVGVLDNGDGSVTFSAIADGSVTYDDLTPYYVLMDKATSFDNYETIGGYTLDPYPVNYTEGYDSGMSLTNYQYYNIPEPAAIILLLGGGGILVGVRRIFMI